MFTNCRDSLGIKHSEAECKQLGNYFGLFLFAVVSVLVLDQVIESQNVLSWKGPIRIRVQLLALCGALQEPRCA